MCYFFELEMCDKAQLTDKLKYKNLTINFRQKFCFLFNKPEETSLDVC